MEYEILRVMKQAPGMRFSGKEIGRIVDRNVFREDPHIFWTIMIMLGWVGGLMMQIVAGAITRIRR